MKAQIQLQMTPRLRHLLVLLIALIFIGAAPAWILAKVLLQWESAEDIAFRRNSLTKALKGGSSPFVLDESVSGKLFFPNDERPVQLAKLQSRLQEYATSSGVVPLSATETSTDAGATDFASIAIKMEVSGTLTAQLALLALIEGSAPWLHVQSVSYRSSEVPGASNSAEPLIAGNITVWTAVREAKPSTPPTAGASN